MILGYKVLYEWTEGTLPSDMDAIKKFLGVFGGGGTSNPSPVKTYLCILIQNGFIKMQTICMEGKNKEWQSFQVVFEVCWIHRGGGL